MRTVGLLLLLGLLPGCQGPTDPAPGPPAAAQSPRPAAPASPSTPAVDVTYRIDVRISDAAAHGAALLIERTLSDPRGWKRAGFSLVRRDDPRAPFVIVLAEGAVVDRLCLPYETYGEYSCQNGPVVALNADRWRSATPQWTGDLTAYRQMLVNHEVGHLLGQRHPPPPQCPAAGVPALVMSQQSTELDGCLPNPWPLDVEIDRAARHDEPLAPPYGR